jgi:peptide/nickel transport system substrate-binding protein
MMKERAFTRSGTKIGLLLLLLCLASGLVWGIAAAMASDPSPSPSSGKVILRIGWTREPDNLNPFLGYSASDYEIFHMQYDLLTGYDAKTWQPEPELAESWTTSKDGLTWTFKIRKGATWQDGQPVTAHDVAFTFNYVIDNDMSAFTGYTEGIKKVTAVDDSTVVFTCSRPKSNMLGMWVPILPEHVWSKVDPKDAGTGYANETPIVGSGPFQVVEWKKGSYIRLEANKAYWGVKPKIDEVIFETYQNADTLAQDMKTGALDAAWGIPPAQMKTLGSTPGMKAISYVVTGFDQLTFNCAPAPATGNPVLRDVAFRRALNYAIDKQKIADIAYDGLVKPATSLIPSGLYSTDLDYHWEPAAAEVYPFDLEKAKAALDAAGYKDSDGDGVREDKQGKPIVLRLLARNESIMSQQSGKFIAGWFKDIGLDIKYQSVSEAALSDKVWNMVGGKVQPDYDMFLWGWVGDIDPNFLVSISTTDQAGMWNQSVYSNPEYDRLFTAQAQELDPQQRKQTIWDMQKIIYRDSPFIPLIYTRSQEAYDTAHWTGWVSSPAKDGGVFYTYQTDSYLNVKPLTATASSSSASSGTTWIVAVVIVALIAVVVVFLLVRRGRGRSVEES